MEVKHNMATIKDIAKRAGVSHGTVSNVLNKKGNVSAAKIKQVEKAATELGYTLNHQAASLRKGSLQLITVIIPYQSREKYGDFYSGMLQRAEEKEFDISLVYLRVRSELKELLEKEAAKMTQSIVLVGLNPKEDEIKDILKKVKIYIYNDRPNFNLKNIETWSYDVTKIIEDVKKEIGSFKKLPKIFLALNIFEQDSYWANEIKEQFKGVQIERVLLDSSNRLSAYFELLNKTTPNDVILFLDVYIAEDFLNMIRWSTVYQERLPYILSFSSNQEFHNPMIKYYEFNLKKDGYNLVADMIKNKKNDVVVLPSYGFFHKKEYTKRNDDIVIKILTLESPMSDAMNQMTPIFEHEFGIKVEITQMPYVEIREKMLKSQQAELIKYDIIRLDVAWMESIGETVLKSLDGIKEINAINKSLKALPKQYTHIKGIQYALPLDASMQVLFYRKDLFDDLLVQRQFFEMYKRDLEVPQTFEEFDEVAQYFSKSINPNSPIEYGHSYAQDNPELLVSSVLPRINEKFKADSRLTFAQIFEESIAEYKLTEAYSHKEDNVFWSNIAKNFSKGLTAMEILYSNYAADILTSTEHFDKSDIGYSLIPGRQSLLGGGSIGIQKQTKNTAEAILFLEWLYSNEISQMITSLGGVLHNRRTNENMNIIEIYPWMRKLDEYFGHASRLQLGNEHISYEREVEIGEEILKQLKK